MAIINRLPKGLLSFLDQQTQGKNPQEPIDGLFLTSQIDAFYRAQQAVGNNVTATIDSTNMTTIVNSSLAEIAVPEGQVWEILCAEGRFMPNGNPGGTINYSQNISLFTPFSGGGVGQETTVASARQQMNGVASAVHFTAVAWLPPQRLILTPGMRMRAQITEGSSGLIGLVGMWNQLRVVRYAWQI